MGHADITALARQAAGRGMTGSVEAHPRQLNRPVTLYFYDGRLYALHGEGCEPPVVRRLLATGVLDAANAERMLAAADGSQAEVGKATVRAGLLPVERLAALHQEFLLAAFGALTAAGEMKATTHDGATTNEYCALPAPVDDIVGAVQARAARAAGAWQSVTGDPHFQDRQLLAGDGVIALTIPEADAIRSAVRADGVASVDSVAHAVGLTRAEAVHLVVQLVHGGELVIGELADVATTTLVPEALLDPKPEPVKQRRGWFRRHAPVETNTAAEMNAAVVEDVEPEPGVGEPETADITAEIAQMQTVVIETIAVDAESVEIESVDADSVEIERVVTEAIPLVIDPLLQAPNGNGWHHESSLHGPSLHERLPHEPSAQPPSTAAPSTTIVRAVDSELIEAVHARLDHLVSELDDLRRLLRQMEAQS